MQARDSMGRFARKESDERTRFELACEAIMLAAFMILMIWG
jgi:hypothetical protein